MKKMQLFIFIISLIFSIAFGKYIFTFFTKGIIVKYQRVTGPELIVIKNEERLYKSSQQKVDYSELFVLDNLDSYNGPQLKSDQIYIIQVEITGFRSISSDSEILYPLIKINNITNCNLYYVECFLFVLFTCISLTNLVFLLQTTSSSLKK